MYDGRVDSCGGTSGGLALVASMTFGTRPPEIIVMCGVVLKRTV